MGALAYAEPLGRPMQAAAHSAHVTLYALMIAMPISGYVLSTAGGNEAPWFGLFSFPSFLPKDKALSQAGGEAHYVFAWAIAFVLALHLGAVVWHAGVRHDAILTRMWPGYRPGSATAIS